MDFKNPNPVIRNAKKHFSQEGLNDLEDAVRTEVSIPNGYLTLTEAKKLIEQARYAEQLEAERSQPNRFISTTEDVYVMMERVGKHYGPIVDEFLQSCLKLGFVVHAVSHNELGKIVIKEDGKPDQIIEIGPHCKKTNKTQAKTPGIVEPPASSEKETE